MSKIKTIRSIKLATSIVDMVVAVLTTGFLILSLVMVRYLNEGGASLWKSTGSIDVQMTVSTITDIATIVLMVIFFIDILLLLVAAIHGFVLCARTNTLLYRGTDVYLHSAKRDSILKLVLNGIAVLAGISSINLTIAALIVVCGLEIWALVIMKDL